ncbi:hypothetical protein EIP98_05820 [Xanthomonas campestris pv. raphani]
MPAAKHVVDDCVQLLIDRMPGLWAVAMPAFAHQALNPCTLTVTRGHLPFPTGRRWRVAPDEGAPAAG